MQHIWDFFDEFKHSLFDHILFDFLKWLFFLFLFWLVKKLLTCMKGSWKHLSPGIKNFVKNHMQWFSKRMRKLDKKINK